MKLAMAQMSMTGSMDENLKNLSPSATLLRAATCCFSRRCSSRRFSRNMRAGTQIFVAMCNRVGREDGMDFAGESLIVHPSGDVLCKADDRERLIVQELDLAEARLWREQKRPYLRQRRPECYL